MRRTASCHRKQDKHIIHTRMSVRFRGSALLLGLLLNTHAAAQSSECARIPDSLSTARASSPASSDCQPLSHTLRARTILATGAAVGAIGLEALRRTQDHRRLTGPFTIGVGFEYSRGADKPGHVFSAGLQAEAWSLAYRWAGHSRTDAALWGAGTAFSWMLAYEVLDGYGRNEFFDPTDVLANAAGAAEVALRPHLPVLEAVRLKASYWPSGDDCDPSCDYAGQTLWLTITPDRFLPDLGLPPWLNVAGGYGARDGTIQQGYESQVVYLGLDINAGGLPLSGGLWERVRPILDRVHLPAPAVRLTPSPRVVLLAY